MANLLSEPTHGVNVPLLRKVLEHVTAHPEEWNQAEWARRDSCGTAYCIAGHTVVMAGNEVRWSPFCFEHEYEVSGTLVDGRRVGDVAVELLGIPIPLRRVGVEKGHLFYSENTLSDLWRIASQLTDGEIEIPEEFQ
jgi:hypothetical protein